MFDADAVLTPRTWSPSSRPRGGPPPGGIASRCGSWSGCAATRPSATSPSCSSAATATPRPPAALIMVCADEGEDERTARYAAVDAGAAIAQLTIEAVSRGLIAHPMAGFNADGAREVFGIPTGCGRSRWSRSDRSATTQRARRSSNATRRAAHGCRWRKSRSRAAGGNRCRYDDRQEQALASRREFRRFGRSAPSSRKPPAARERLARAIRLSTHAEACRRTRRRGWRPWQPCGPGREFTVGHVRPARRPMPGRRPPRPRSGFPSSRGFDAMCSACDRLKSSRSLTGRHSSDGRSNTV